MNKMLRLFLKLFGNTEPKTNNYFDTLFQNAENHLNKYRDRVCGKDEYFCNTLFSGIIIFACILCLCQLYISRIKSKKRGNAEKKTKSSEKSYKMLNVNFHASSKPFGFLPGSKIYVIHRDTQEDFILSNGKRSIGAQTIVSIHANNMFIYGQMERDAYVPKVRGTDNAKEKQSITNKDNKNLEDDSYASDEATVIAKPSVIFEKPAFSRIPVIVRGKKSLA